jgi:hypothetical protein
MAYAFDGNGCFVGVVDEPVKDSIGQRGFPNDIRIPHSVIG